MFSTPLKCSKVAHKWFRRTQKQEFALRLQKVLDDPVAFCSTLLDLRPYPYQEQFLRDRSQFIALRWSRQSGKTLIVAAYLLWYAIAHPNSSIAIVSPSFRQSKQVIRKVAPLAHRLAKVGLVVMVEKAKIECWRGSRIEAFPNSPETIRGPTLNVVYWDEVNHTVDDEDLYTAILFTLGTTNGQFIGSSTPGSSSSIFYRMCFSDEFKAFSRHHVGWRNALEPDGPLKQSILESIREQLRHDPWRWTREMEAEFSEDEGRWLSLELILSCQAGDEDHLEYVSLRNSARGSFYVGLDLAKYQDYAVLTVIEKRDRLRIVCCHRFPHGTEYGAIIGQVKDLLNRWERVCQVWIDQTGLGEYVWEDMSKTIPVLTGVKFTQEQKQSLAQALRQAFIEKELLFPYDPDLIEELHCEQYSLTKSGSYVFSHPQSSHDDRFWSLALAVTAAKSQVSGIPVSRAIL